MHMQSKRGRGDSTDGGSQQWLDGLSSCERVTTNLESEARKFLCSIHMPLPHSAVYVSCLRLLLCLSLYMKC